MQGDVNRKPAGILAFVFSACVAFAASLLALNQELSAAKLEIVAVAVTFDAIVVVPLGFYLIGVRPRKWPVVAVVPVVLLGFLFASLVLPTEHRSALAALETLLVPLELSALAWLACRVRSAIKHGSMSSTDDPGDWLLTVSEGIVGRTRAAQILKSELAVFYYGLGVGSAPHAPDGASAMTYHEKSGHKGLAIAAATIVALEGLVIHTIVAQWSSTFAWILTAGTIYAGLWILADFRASVRRPILVRDESIVLRAGLRWDASVSKAQVAGVSRSEPEVPAKERLNMTFLGVPSIWILFAQPITVHGPYGTRREVRAIGLDPDEPIEPHLT